MYVILRSVPLFSFSLFPQSLETPGTSVLPHRVHFNFDAPPQLRQLCTPSALLLFPLSRPSHSIHRHLCPTYNCPCSTNHPSANTGTRRHPPASQIRPREG